MKENTCENLLTANVTFWTYIKMYGFCVIDTITFLHNYLATLSPHQILLISGEVVVIIPHILIIIWIIMQMNIQYQFTLWTQKSVKEQWS